jgi:hypothetical protein
VGQAAARAQYPHPTSPFRNLTDTYYKGVWSERIKTPLAVLKISQAPFSVSIQYRIYIDTQLASLGVSTLGD